MRRLLVALLLVGVVAVVVMRGDVPCGIVGWQPHCYVALEPGPSEDAAALVDVDGARAYASSGELRLSTVAVDEDLGVEEWWRSLRSSAVETVPRATLFPPDADHEEVTRENAALMAQSQLSASVAGLRAAGYEVDADPDGARVAEVLRAEAGEALEVGDVLVAVGEVAVRDPDDVVAAVERHAPGDRVELTVRRGGQRRRVAVPLGAHASDRDRAFLGVALLPHLDLPVDVSIDAGVIGGPSAGLMFALAVVDRLGADELTGGEVVAGTGTLEPDGTVGPVGGVRQKVVGAAEPPSGERPARVFLIPEANVADVEGVRTPRGLLLAPVRTLDDALAAVSAVADGRRPAGALALPAQKD